MSKIVVFYSLSFVHFTLYYYLYTSTNIMCNKPSLIKSLSYYTQLSQNILVYDLL